MGQGYLAIILGEKPQTTTGETIRTYVNSHHYNNGYKLTEHSYLRNPYVSAVESLICPTGQHHKSRIVWAGDYADCEQDGDMNLYLMTGMEPNEEKICRPDTYDVTNYRFIVNHTKNLYVDKGPVVETLKYHPLPLLTAEGNGRGGGDYRGNMIELIGSWARDVISVEAQAPDGFQELICDFKDEYSD